MKHFSCRILLPIEKIASTLILMCCFQAGAVEDPKQVHKFKQYPHEGIITGTIANGTEPNYIFVGKMGRDRPGVTKETIFEIGSISKVFAGIILADTVLSGKAEYDDPVSMYLPKSAIGKASPFHAITLMHLATHTSGLQRDHYPKKYDPLRPFADINAKMLNRALRDLTLDDLAKPGDYEYSNLGVGILGYVLGRIWEKQFAQLVSEKICTPLAMTHTFIPDYDHLPEGIDKILATGHKRGEAMPPWGRGELAAAGAIVSSAEDMMKFAKAHWDKETPDPLRRAMKDSAKLRHGKTQAICWIRNGDVISHGGTTTGFQSHLEIDLKKKSASVVLQNSTGKTFEFTTSGKFEDIAGYWSGHLKGNGNNLRIFCDIKADGRVVTFSIDQGGWWTPADLTERRGEQVAFAFTMIDGLYKGIVKENEMIGTWSQYGAQYTQNFKKVDEIPKRLIKLSKARFSPSIGKLAGYWSGYLRGKKDLFVYASIEQIGEILTIEFYSPDQDSTPISVTSAKLKNGNDFKLRVAKIKGSFEGKLSKDRKQIKGIWKQGVPQPLVLNWSESVPERE